MRLGFIALMAGSLACLQSPAFGQDEEPIDRTPRECISTDRISYTRVVDERTILFYMFGRTVYRNDLQQECRGLARRNQFIYSTRNGRLCDVDFVTVPDPGRGTSCTVGQFHPITREEARILLRDPAELDAINRSVEVEEVELPPEEAPEAGR